MDIAQAAGFSITAEAIQSMQSESKLAESSIDEMQ